MDGGPERFPVIHGGLVHTSLFRHLVQLLDERVRMQQERDELDNFPDDRIRLHWMLVSVNFYNLSKWFPGFSNYKHIRL